MERDYASWQEHRAELLSAVKEQATKVEMPISLLDHMKLCSKTNLHKWLEEVLS